MRKIFTTLSFVFILFSLIGCSADSDLTSLQKQFIKDVEKSLEEKDKWLKSDSEESMDLATFYEEETHFETNLYKYFDKDFEDPLFQEIATEYIKAVKEKEVAVAEYLDSNQEKFETNYFDAEDKRKDALKLLVNHYPLTSNAYDIKEARLEIYIDEILTDLTLEKESNNTYTIKIANSTGADWEDFSIDLYLVDIDREEISPIYIDDFSLPSKKSATATIETDIADAIGVKCESYFGKVISKKDTFLISNSFE